MEDAGLKDTKRIGFSLNFEQERQQGQVKKEASCAPVSWGRFWGYFVAAAHG
jgi:hypothetical protein